VKKARAGRNRGASSLVQEFQALAASVYNMVG
jgi:hypothetical protein